MASDGEKISINCLPQVSIAYCLVIKTNINQRRFSLKHSFENSVVDLEKVVLIRERSSRRISAD